MGTVKFNLKARAVIQFAALTSTHFSSDLRTPNGSCPRIRVMVRGIDTVSTRKYNKNYGTSNSDENR